MINGSNDHATARAAAFRARTAAAPTGAGIVTGIAVFCRLSEKIASIVRKLRDREPRGEHADHDLESAVRLRKKLRRERSMPPVALLG